LVRIGSSKTLGTGLPGTFGVDYDFINKSAIDIYVDQNHVSRYPRARKRILVNKENQANLFRVAFLMERMCPVSYGLGSKFNETVITHRIHDHRINTYVSFLQHYGFFADAINYITVTKGAYAILDPHNYMRYNDPSQQPSTGSIIGDTSDSKAATTAQFGEFWGELAGRFKNNSKVIFGLNNEVSTLPQPPRE